MGVLTVQFVLATHVGPVWNVTAIAVVLMVMIYATSQISGGNLNPAVSFAIMVLNHMSHTDTTVYVIVQVLGGICAKVCAGLFFGFDNLGSAGVKSPYSTYQACLAEFFYTFMLVFMVVNNAVARKTQYYGLTIGFTVIAGGYGAGQMSGGCFNPAVAIALSADWITGIIFVLVELVAAYAAAVVCKFLRPELAQSMNLKKPEKKKSGEAQNCLSEFLGTFFLNLTVGTNVLPQNGSAVVWAISISLGNMIFALGDISGAHFNPAVTVAILCRGKCNVHTAIKYIFSQLVGSVSAALISWAMFRGSGHHPTFAFHQVHDHHQWSLTQALGAEFMATFTLAYVVLCVATTAMPVIPEYFGFVIGSCVLTGALAVGGISMGSLNPSVTVGFSLIDMLLGHHRHKLLPWLLYVGVELAGGVLAALVFKFATHPSEFAQNGHEPASVDVAPVLDA